MCSNTLDSRGRAILETLENERVGLGTLDARLDMSAEELEERMEQLNENSLVRAVDGEEYELTENGRRLLRATPIGTYDNRIDTPPAVDRMIDDFSHRPDEKAAVRNAFSFLRYWGDATSAEIVDGCYSESPAGYGTGQEWWARLVSDRLAVLPSVHTPSETDSSIERWEYEKTPVVESSTDSDGRDVADPETSSTPFGSVRHGFGKLSLSDEERTAARIAFAELFERESATTGEIAERVFDEHGAGYDSVDEWTNWLESVFEELPGIEGISDAADDLRWRYSPVSDDRGNDGERNSGG